MRTRAGPEPVAATPTAPAAVPTLRLSVDASAVPVQPTGAGRYVIELVRALNALPGVDLTLFCRRGDGDRWRRGEATVVERAPVHRPVRLAWEQVELPRLLGDLPIDVHHCPHYTMPERARVPRVVTVHDMTFFDHPEWHERPKVLYFRRAIRAATTKADALITPSERAAERIADALDLRAPLHVVPHGVDHRRFTPPGASAADDDAVLARLGIERPYVAFVGTLEPRKDVPTLVRAFDRLAGGHPGLGLVLAGGDGWGTAAVDEAIAGSAHPERIRRVGYLPEAEKPALLRRADTVSYPSQEEGFGLPVLEALACGAPLVTTEGSAMAAMAGGSALLAAAGNVDSLAQALEASLAGGPEVAERRRLGIEVAGRYTWAAAAARHLEVFRTVV